MTPADASDELRLSHAPPSRDHEPEDAASARAARALSDEQNSLFPDLEEAAAPQAQHWLTDWYRYLDQVSRPVRRAGEGEPEPAWRPWRPESNEQDEVPEERLHPDAIPMLDLGMGSTPEAATSHGATAEVEDPTLYDELRPIPQFSVPTFRAPSFELTRPRPIGAPAPEPVIEAVAAESATPAPIIPLDAAVAPVDAPALQSWMAETAPALAQETEEAADGEGEGGESREPTFAELSPREEGPVNPGDLRRSPKYLEMLQQIRDPDVAQNSYKGRFQESRDELLQRLLDPLLTLEEASRLLGVCPTTVRRYTNKGALKHLRTQGNQRRFRLSDVLEFLESRSSEIAADARADREAGRQ